MADTLAAPPAIEISEEIGAVLTRAMDNWKPVAVAYVDANNKPQLSYRGSVQRLNDKQLALWGRSTEGGLVKALASHPTLSLLYADWTQDARVYLSFVGRGKVVSDKATRDAIYANQPEIERDHDKERKGVAIVIDVDQVIGLLGGKYVQMGAPANAG